VRIAGNVVISIVIVFLGTCGLFFIVQPTNLPIFPELQRRLLRLANRPPLFSVEVEPPWVAASSPSQSIASSPSQTIEGTTETEQRTTKKPDESTAASAKPDESVAVSLTPQPAEQAPAIAKSPVPAPSANVHAADSPDDKRQLRDALLKIRPTLSHSAAGKLAQTIAAQCRLYGFDPMLALAIAKVESDVGVNCLSKKGARGIMQVLPATGKEGAHQLGIPWHGLDTLDSFEQNISIGMWYLHSLESRFSDLELAIIAYNRGPNRLADELAKGQTKVGYLSRVMNAYARLTGPRTEDSNRQD